MSLGGVLTACQLQNDLLIAGYANGKTCLWNVESNCQHSLEATAEVHQDPSKASVECVAALGDVCATAYSCGGLIMNTFLRAIFLHCFFYTRTSHVVSSETKDRRVFVIQRRIFARNVKSYCIV